jgi:hypothetical protein
MGARPGAKGQGERETVKVVSPTVPTTRRY